jgi:ubiquinone/menaquinone biosynthesis C-methylase UbiE
MAGCANANVLDTIPSTSVDIVLASMVLMDVEDYEGAVHEIHRILAPHGELVMSITLWCSPRTRYGRLRGDARRANSRSRQPTL